MDVLRLLATGLSNREIGLALNIAEKTVRMHMSHIFEKLGVADRTQAVIIAIQRGIVHLER
jgi:DNA-binding NarL/FixJ family response regulator